MQFDSPVPSDSALGCRVLFEANTSLFKKIGSREAQCAYFA